jgi:DNA-binding NarL/FixJ family response regulator
LQKILELKPDAAIIDLSLKTGGGLELIKQLRTQPLKTRLLVFTMLDETIYAERALRAGADGFITKEEGAEKAVEAIRLLRQGKRYVSAEVAERVLQTAVGGKSGAGNGAGKLSDRELEILEHISSGLGSRQIASKLGVSLKTVESHREHIKLKLNLSSAAELVNYAYSLKAPGQALHEREAARGADAQCQERVNTKQQQTGSLSGELESAPADKLRITGSASGRTARANQNGSRS